MTALVLVVSIAAEADEALPVGVEEAPPPSPPARTSFLSSEPRNAYLILAGTSLPAADRQSELDVGYWDARWGASLYMFIGTPYAPLAKQSNGLLARVAVERRGDWWAVGPTAGAAYAWQLEDGFENDEKGWALSIGAFFRLGARRGLSLQGSALFAAGRRGDRREFGLRFSLALQIPIVRLPRFELDLLGRGEIMDVPEFFLTTSALFYARFPHGVVVGVGYRRDGVALSVGLERDLLASQRRN